ncbi:MAG TPA: PilZ domain-containing protein [Terriglobales bacterium]|nr:PilZ domain-containing protein [Terriglobales bacterium]
MGSASAALLVPQVATGWNLALLLAGVAACAGLVYVMLRLSPRPPAAPEGREPAVPPPTLRTRARDNGQLHAADIAEVHKLRRDRRVPIVTAVTVRTAEGATATGTTREISAGGMSLQLAGAVKVSQPVEVEFVLPSAQPTSVHAVVWWRKGDMIGVRFDYADESRLRIKDWLRAQAVQPAP